MRVVHFASAFDFRRWLEANHATAREIWVGFWRKDSGRTGLDYSGALDEALCFGWIGGVRRSIGARRYAGRFTPRRRRNHWSEANRGRIAALIAQDRVAVPGLEAYAARAPRARRRLLHRPARR